MIGKNEVFSLQTDEYKEHLLKQCWGNIEGGISVSLREIAVNLHEIAKQLAEMNGKKPPEDESNA